MLDYRIQGAKVPTVCSRVFHMRELGPAQTEALCKNTREQSADAGFDNDG